MPLEMKHWKLIWIGLLLFVAPGLAASNVSLSIIPSGPIAPRVGGFLNITCYVVDNEEHPGKYKLEWIVPEATFSRVNLTRQPNALTLLIDHILDGDSGVYFCNASAEEQDRPALVANVTVLKVLPRKGSCSPGFFICKNGDCIIQRFLCDGHPDCPDGSDEIEFHCGPEPCKGKVPCEDRCIPNEICCFHPFDGQCPFHQPDCCKDYFIGSKAYGQLHAHENLHRGLLDDPHRGILEDRHKRYESDMGFLQSTIYTIIGCAVAFIFIVTIMVVAVCRVHMKQAAMAPRPRALVTRSSLYWAQRSSQDLTAYVGEQGAGHVQHLAYPPSTNLLVTYNINNGVQLVGRLVEPPPYSEVAEETPVTDGPPPPYSSAENLHPGATSTGIPPVTRQARSPNLERNSNHALLRPTTLNRGRDDN